MATPTEFLQQNLVLKPAPGDEESVSDLNVYADGRQFVSCWALSPEELAEVTRTGRVWAFVLAGRQPPIAISGTDPFPQS